MELLRAKGSGDGFPLQDLSSHPLVRRFLGYDPLDSDDFQDLDQLPLFLR